MHARSFRLSIKITGRCRIGGAARLDRRRPAAPIQTMDRIRTVCVYCGSSPGARPQHMQQAAALGRALAEAGVGLVYGGGNIGLMGAVARATLEAGGHVTGIIPQFLVDREVMLSEVQELVVTADMHERKRLMFERSDAFVALPGGVGTLEELVEQLTWAQLGRHDKPVLIADLDGFWSPLLVLIEHMKTEGFIRQGLSVPYVVATSIEEILPLLERVAPPFGDDVAKDEGALQQL